MTAGKSVPKKGHGARGNKRQSEANGRGQSVSDVKRAQVISILDGIIDPHTGQSLMVMKLVEDIRLKNDEVSVTWRPTQPFCQLGMDLSRSIQGGLKSLKWVSRANVKIVGHMNEEYINGLLDRSSRR